MREWTAAAATGIRRVVAGFVLVGALACASAATAHPVPFSYVDVRIDGQVIDVTIVAHIFDLAHDLGIDPPERLLDAQVTGARGAEIVALVASRFHLDAAGRPLACRATAAPEILRDRQSLATHFACPMASRASAVDLQVVMFPYDPQHQTFVNIYEAAALATQTILDGRHDRFEYFAGTPQGTLAVVRKFIQAGVHHILIGPDHLLFLVGLLLLGGNIRRLAIVVTAFTIAHSLTLTLAALRIVTPPARIIEPAIALSIIYVGADNLLAGSGRDVRAWIAFTFGFVHGFGFANVLREMDLPARALGWSLFSFNLGVEIGQLAVVMVVATVLAAIRARSEAVGRRLVLVGSLAVIAAGAFWFVQRVLFPGGM